MSPFWKILFVIVAIYYSYVAWVLFGKKKGKSKINKKNDGYLHINDNFVNNALDEQTDLEAILSQVDEAENNSKLLEAFEKGSKSDQLNNSLTRKENEKFKIIRNKDSTDTEDSDSGT